MFSSSGEVVKGAVTQVVLFQIGPSLGHFWIRPETLADKFSELFFPREIDPPHAPQFSERFYFWADRPDKIKRVVPRYFYETIASYRDLIVAGSDSHMMAARALYLSPMAARQLVEFAFRSIVLFS